MEKDTLYQQANVSSNANIIERQRQFFQTGKTRSYEFRIEQLKKYKSLLKKNEDKIINALYTDMHRNKAEANFEYLLCLIEVDEAIKNLKSWMIPVKAPSNILLFPSNSQTYYEPYGVSLIIAPWNFPFLLTFNALVATLAAGNCVIVKPSEIAPASGELIKEILSNFSEEYIYTAMGGPEVSEGLLKEKFDFIFFTGGTAIGKIVAKAAAEHLTPTVLELGGKTPCIIDETASIDLAARRIVWGKFFNTGQTCIAPDFLYVHEKVKAKLIPKMIEAIKEYFSKDAYSSPDFGRIINRKHFERIRKLISKDKVIYGGQTIIDDNFIGPTLMDNVTWDDPAMKEEIFGPILPILSYSNFDEMIKTLQSKPSPLALYLFTTNRNHEKTVMDKLQFGNGCINDVLMQFNPYTAFGGVGNSGCGCYHGKSGYENFSYRRTIVKRSISFFDSIFPYPSSTNPAKATRIRNLTRWILGR